MPPVLAPFSTVRAPTAMVASVDGLATQAALAVLALGGNAVDGAIAANAVLAVTTPYACGLGGDLFALVHVPGTPAPAALDASGRAGSGADPERLRAEGHGLMPYSHDVRSVPVPGCVDGWLALHARFGRLPLAEVLAPAVGYAEDGFPASPALVRAVAALVPPVAPAGEALRDQAKAVGDRVVRPGMARTLRAIASQGRDGFYGGEFGAGLLALGAGEYTEADLAEPGSTWKGPLSVDAWGRTVWTMPPASQGYLTLAGAAVAAGLDLPTDPDDERWPHLLAEAAHAVAHDRPDVLWDGADGTALLGPDRLAAARASVGADSAQALRRRGPLRFGPGHPPRDTTYLCVVDGERLGVSLIQSNAAGFGSHLFEPSTGINLHNRGIGFSLTPGHPAEYGPGRRPPHTLSPALVTGPDGTLTAVLGTQGGDAQPQVLLQLLARWLHGDQSAGAAVAGPRAVFAAEGRGFDTWTSPADLTLLVEDHAPAAWFTGLAERGHLVRRVPGWAPLFGHAHLIAVAAQGHLEGAADPRSVSSSAAGR